MSMKTSENITPKLQRALAVLPDALEELGQNVSAVGEQYAKMNAPWNNQTNFARESLFSDHEVTGDTLTIVVGTTNDEYGPFLELGTENMAPLPIIEPTVQHLAPQLEAAVGKLIEGLLK